MKFFICQSCNNEMIFNKTEGTLTCPVCNHTMNVTDFEHPTLGTTSSSTFISEIAKNNIDESNTYDEPANHFQDESESSYYIPFKTNSGDISKLFGKKLTMFFLKSSFKKILKNKAFKKIYFPIWNHNTATNGTLNAICSNFDKDATNYYLNEKEMTVFISNLNTAASSKNIQTDISSLFPYNFEDAQILSDKAELKEFDEFIDADISSETYTDTISDFASSITETKLNSHTKAFSSSYNKEYTTDTKIRSSHVVYLPIWEIAFNYDIDKLYINGQTGKISGHFPLSKLKIALSFCTVSAVLFAIISLIFFNFVI